mmetsp:Transcript_14123/g.28889  ORF Transcript_14123/g.28889 Transcript_14123/m.28889 type:complete len:535 (-) Transcript_14123:2933-4537(-)
MDSGQLRSRGTVASKTLGDPAVYRGPNTGLVGTAVVILPNEKDAPNLKGKLLARPPYARGEDVEARRFDTMVETILFTLALALRSAFISRPRRIVFDEIHFVRFSSWYLTGQYFFEIHPPLGKLLYAVASYLSGFHPQAGTFNPNQLYDAHHFIVLRLVSAFFGSLHVLMMYRLCRMLRMSRLVCIAGALMPCLDNMLVIESRLILLNPQLMCWSVTALYCATRLWSYSKGSRERWVWLVLTATTGSFALSTKWTAAVSPLLIGIISVIGLYSVCAWENRLSLIECSIAGLIAVAWYTLFFIIHFALLPGTGEGDVFMRDEWKRARPSSTFYRPGAAAPSFIETYLYLNGQMYARSAGITTRHPFESHWYEWPINLKGMRYHTFWGKKGFSGYLTVIVNPFLSLLAVVGIVTFVVFAIRYLLRSRKQSEEAPKPLFIRLFRVGTVLLVGYWLNLLPYTEVSRPAFSYHYMPALLMAELIVCLLLDSIENQAHKSLVTLAVIGGLVTAFIFWSPWTFGILVPKRVHSMLHWMPRW